ncbi:hypothetical protein SAMN05421659_13117 [[Clostridium] fimetarium]|uniref:Uncharacterized protein n=1 Tax=[Clostridium] fimetarium TaxID=99656 RepID=A0A1I0RXN2_9FIRM|nr:hypothetical protein SAMN05421659_13117 [[Clostridium] fimetarium]
MLYIRMEIHTIYAFMVNTFKLDLCKSVNCALYLLPTYEIIYNCKSMSYTNLNKRKN